jgi:hypothetical protein
MESYASTLYTELLRSGKASEAMVPELETVSGACVPNPIPDVISAEQSHYEKAINTRLSFLDRNSDVPTFLSDIQQCEGERSLFEASNRQQALGVADVDAAEAEKLRLNNENWVLLTSKVKVSQKHLLPIKWMEDNKDRLSSWLEYLPNVEVPAQSRLRCSLCNRNKKSSSLVQRYIPDLAKDEGALKSNPELNRKLLGEHLSSTWHTTLTNEEKLKKAKRIETTILNAEKLSYETLSKMQQSTADMLLVIYAESRMYLPFESHPTIVKLLEMLGISWLHHHKHARAPPLFLDYISNDMHEKLLKHLMKHDRPLSIMMDTASDSVGNDFLVIQFQALESDQPVVYFFRNILMGPDVTS